VVPKMAGSSGEQVQWQEHVSRHHDKSWQAERGGGAHCGLLVVGEPRWARTVLSDHSTPDGRARHTPLVTMLVTLNTEINIELKRRSQ